MDDLSVPLAATSLASTPGRRDEEVAAASEQSTRKRRASGHSFRDVQLSGHARGHFGNSITNYYNDEYSKLLAQLSGFSFASVHRSIQERRMPGSGSWFLKDPKYRTWRNGDSHALWCPGLPGAGKTFLASVIIDDLRSSIDTNSTALVYLYASHDRQFEQTVSSYLCSIARQLVEQQPALDKLSSTKLVSDHLKQAHCRSAIALQSLVVKLAKMFRDVYLVVDALDEFSADLDDRVDLVKSLLSIRNQVGQFDDDLEGNRIEAPAERAAEDRLSRHSFRMCLTSRQAVTITELLAPCVQATVKATEGDITAHILGRIEKSGKLSRWLARDDTLQSQLTRSIIVKSHCIFKLADLQIGFLCNQGSLAGLKRAMATLPHQIDTFYRQTLERIKQHKPAVKTLLIWLMFAEHPLTRVQLGQALAVPDLGDDFEVADAEADIQDLVDCSEGLVHFKTLDARPSLAHETVADFFRRNASLLTSDAHAEIATTCLKFMSLKPCISILAEQMKDEYPSLDESTPLLEWSGYHWWNHADQTSSSEVKCLMSTFARKLKEVESRKARNTTAFALCVKVVWPNWDRLACHMVSSGIQALHGGDAKVVQPLHCAAEGILSSPVKFLIDYDPSIVNVLDHKGRSALETALRSGSHDNFDFLIDHEAVDVNVQDCTGRTLLHHIFIFTSFPRPPDSLSLLRKVARHPRCNAGLFDKYGRTALHYALLRWTSLHYALRRLPNGTCTSSENSMVPLRILIEGADTNPNAADSQGIRALHLVVEASDRKIAQWLLEQPAVQATVTTMQGNTALSLVIHRTCWEWSSGGLGTRESFDSSQLPPSRSIVIQPASPETLESTLAILRLLGGHRSLQVNQVDGYGHTALDWAVFYDSVSSGVTALQGVTNGCAQLSALDRAICRQCVATLRKRGSDLTPVVDLLRTLGASECRAVSLYELGVWQLSLRAHGI